MNDSRTSWRLETQVRLGRDDRKRGEVILAFDERNTAILDPGVRSQVGCGAADPHSQVPIDASPGEHRPHGDRTWHACRPEGSMRGKPGNAQRQIRRQFRFGCNRSSRPRRLALTMGAGPPGRRLRTVSSDSPPDVQEDKRGLDHPPDTSKRREQRQSASAHTRYREQHRTDNDRTAANRFCFRWLVGLHGRADTGLEFGEGSRHLVTVP